MKMAWFANTLLTVAVVLTLSAAVRTVVASDMEKAAAEVERLHKAQDMTNRFSAALGDQDASTTGRKLKQRKSDEERLLAAIRIEDNTLFFQLVTKADVNKSVDVKDSSFLPLEAAIIVGRGDYILALIQAGADPDSVTPDGLTMLEVAISSGKVGAVKALIAGGADVSLSDPFSLAVVAGEPKIVKAFIDAGVDLEGTNLRPLAAASLLGHSDVVKVLILAGANDGPLENGPALSSFFCGCLFNVKLVDACNVAC